jgi:uncharacterized membrane protein YtjA (UPF0391 family)
VPVTEQHRSEIHEPFSRAGRQPAEGRSPQARCATGAPIAGHGGATGAVMLKWAIIFFVISLIAGFFGFTGVASGAKTIAKVLFFIAIVVFLIVLVFGVFLGKLVF